jgi:protocatechuate 3,4-dioxygenase beta subunit
MTETSFARPTRSLSNLSALVWILFSSGVLAASPEPARESPRPAISGTISDPDEKPIAGATVMIWTAGPKRGYSTYCPGCYADCGKRAVTDAKGEFSFERVDPTLRFNLLVVREGFTPLNVRKVEPFGNAVQARLERRSTPADLSQVVRGRVVGPTGRPIADAVVEPEMVWWTKADGTLSGRGGAVKGLDPLAVSNEKGEFEIAYTRPALKMTVCVFARGMAPKWFLELTTGPERHTLAVSRGATIRGRLVQFGKPVPDAEIGLKNKECGMGEHFPESRIGTHADGTFLFANLPAHNEWFVFGKMNSLSDRGATIPVSCRTSHDDEIVDVGDIRIQPGHRIRGRVVLTDRKSIADGMRMNISSTESSDSQTVPLPPDGRFEFRNVPTSEYSLFPSVKGYHLSDKNPNLSWVIEGRIDSDIDDFIILLDPGKESYAGRYAGRFQGKPLVSAKQP